MILNEITGNKKTQIIESALRDHYDLSIDFSNFDIKKSNSALHKVRGLLKEFNSSKKIHDSHTIPGYLKLLMMEQALVSRLEEIHNTPTQIVVENEEVQKSQVILAAQDMIDSVQKMLEQISKMNVEELDAVATGIKNEFGSDVGDTFMSTVGESLSTLQTGLQTAKNSLSSALGMVTGDTTMSSGMDVEPDLGTSDIGLDDMDTDLDNSNLDFGVDDKEDMDNSTTIGRGRR